MLSPALLAAANRLAAILMALVEAIAPIARGGSTPTFPSHAAQTLFFRLAHLVTTLIRINNFGIRAPATPATPKVSTQPGPTTERPSPRSALCLPRRPGWLLAALPDIAPAIAADLAALLADPALIALLAVTPTVHRTLLPLLRGLGLPGPPSNLPPQPDPIRRVRCPVPHQSSNMTPIAEGRVPTAPPAAHPAASNRPNQPTPTHVHFITMS